MKTLENSEMGKNKKQKQSWTRRRWNSAFFVQINSNKAKEPEEEIVIAKGKTQFTAETHKITLDSYWEYVLPYVKTFYLLRLWKSLCL